MLRSLQVFVLLAYCFGSFVSVYAQGATAPTNGGVAPSTNGATTPATTNNGNGSTSPTTTNSTLITGASNTQVINNPDGTQMTIQTFYCPQPSALIKNGLYWGTAVGGWKSYSESFDNLATSFIGSQWIGINVGKMVCLYKGNLSMSFPITLQNDTLSQAPSGGLWGNDLGGYRNCHSTNVLDCPFVVKTQSVNMSQIYQSLDFFKGKPNPLNQNNN